MSSISGIPYNDASTLVETIVSIKKKKYQFPGVDPEDTAQDIRIICWEALSRFDPSKMGKSVFHFVARCVDNRLYNQFRGVYLDNNPPCLRCPEYDRATKTCKIDEVGCDRIVSYRERMARRRAIAAPASYSNLESDSDNANDTHVPDSLITGSLTGVSDLVDEFRALVSDDLKIYYDKIVDGKLNEVPPDILKKIQHTLKDAYGQ
jgi:hypothetical protein